MPVLERHRRRSIRLPRFDYSRAGAYFVTICTYKKELYFWDRNLAGIARDTWDAIPEHFHSVRTDEFIVMPNHIHGIIWLTADRRGRIYPARSLKGGMYAAATKENITLPTVVQNYKAAVTRIGRKTTGIYFAWQRNYYERVIRDDGELNRMRQYVRDNPLNWDSDEDNPGRMT